jgi:hypothetical protein
MTVGGNPRDKAVCADADFVAVGGDNVFLQGRE